MTIEARRPAAVSSVALGIALFTLSRLPAFTPYEQDERAIEALFACQDELGRRVSPDSLAVADWEPRMVEHRGGNQYRVNSYVDEVKGEQTVRRISYTCNAVRVGADDWRISSLEIQS